MSILIKNALTADGKRTDIHIEGNHIDKVGRVRKKADTILDCKDKAALPGLVNTHTHAAMTLFRGYADDMPFYEAWPRRIWPAEAKLTGRDVYWGTRLACLEMLKSGTTCFNDMYFYAEDIARAVRDAGIRAVVSELYLDNKQIHADEVSETKTAKTIGKIKKAGGSRVTPALGPHAIYTVSKENLAWVSEYAGKHKLLMHFHLSETDKENQDCIKKYGKRPVPLLEEIGFLNDNLIAAHCVWLTENEVKTLAKHKVNVAHTPTSNMKLAVGGIIPYAKMKNAGVNVTLGTDGCASNNNLSMLEAMKTAAVLHKHDTIDPTTLPATDALKMATLNAGKALKLKAGSIKKGMLADIILIDLKKPELTPNHNLTSNIVYAANPGCVDTTICDGKIIMHERKIKDEEKILKEVEKTTKKLMEK
jgi:5-methylthioadenosine/S-adenosylhomocysteine deaminase